MEASNGRGWYPRRSTIVSDFASQVSKDAAVILDYEKWYRSLRLIVTTRAEGDQWSWFISQSKLAGRGPEPHIAKSGRVHSDQRL